MNWQLDIVLVIAGLSVAIIALIIAYDYLAISRGKKTLSQRITETTKTFPIVGVIIGIVIGHLFWHYRDVSTEEKSDKHANPI